MRKKPMEKAYPYNETSNDRIKKYTLNMPIPLYDKAKAKARSLGIYRVSIYLRAILERELSKEDCLSMNEIIDGQKESLRIASAEHRREKIEIIEKDKRSFIKLATKKWRDIFQPKQSIFDFSKKVS